MGKEHPGRVRGMRVGPNPTLVFKPASRPCVGEDISYKINLNEHQNMEIRLSKLESQMGRVLSILEQRNLQVNDTSVSSSDGSSSLVKFHAHIDQHPNSSEATPLQSEVSEQVIANDNPTQVCSMGLRLAPTQVFKIVSHPHAGKEISYEINLNDPQTNIDARLSTLELQMAKVLSIMEQHNLGDIFRW